MAAIVHHIGPLDASSHQNRALRFVESYSTEICQDLTLPYSPTKYFSPTCDFQDTTDVTYQGADAIKAWMQQLFSPFDRLDIPTRKAIVIEHSTSKDSRNDGIEQSPIYTVVVEHDAYHWFKGDAEPIVVPRAMIIEISESVTDDGFDGLQFSSVRLYWNTALLVEERKRRVEGNK
jgi:hypothetical protein